MKYSVVIELSAPEDQTSGIEIEKMIGRALKPYSKMNDIQIVHLEASPGTLAEAFGIGATPRSTFS